MEMYIYPNVYESMRKAGLDYCCVTRVTLSWLSAISTVSPILTKSGWGDRKNLSAFKSSLNKITGFLVE
jgi:hypothetical protein